MYYLIHYLYINHILLLYFIYTFLYTFMRVNNSLIT